MLLPIVLKTEALGDRRLPTVTDRADLVFIDLISPWPSASDLARVAGCTKTLGN